MKLTRAEAFGRALADAVIEAAHLTYNASRGKAIVAACIKRLRERIGEIQPKEADPKYKKARYGKSRESQATKKRTPK